MAEPPPSTPTRRPPPWLWQAALVVLALAVLGGAYALTRDDDGAGASATSTSPTTTAATTAPATSESPQAAVVPELAGGPGAEAVRALADEGLYAEVAYVLSDKPEGTVVAQAHDPGTELQPGDVVALNLSVGPRVAEYISVPDVAGLELSEARRLLEQARFEVVAVDLQDEARDTDAVDGQTPEASAGVPRGSLVVLYVSR
jgi:hypothetical protein